MEKRFAAAFAAAQDQARALGVRTRPVPPEEALALTRRCLGGRRPSQGFEALAALGRLDLTPEALAVDSRFTALFTDEQANEALARLVEAGYWGAGI